MNRVTLAVFAGLLSLPGVVHIVDGALPDLVVSSNNSYWQTGTLTKPASGTADVVVDTTNKKQNWEGFGGTFNEMGWDALNAVSSEIPKAMKLLFDANEGANLAQGRIPVGASDYAMSWYTLAETAGDFTMSKFSIARDREKLIPFIKAALQVKPDILLWGSPWTVPSWMMDGSNMKSDAQTQGAHALYLAKFVEEYAKEGITIKAVHPQNEPGYARVRWAQPLLINYFKTYLAPKFAERNCAAEIWCGTMSAPADSNIAIGVANDLESMKYVKGFGLQWNHTTTVPTLAAKGRVWQTEHRCGNYNFEAIYWDKSRYSATKPQNDYLYGEESWLHIRDWIVAGVNAYCAWNMVLDTYGKSLDNWPQNALLVVDRTAKTLTVTPAYYVFRHFSQYITPGATRIATTGSSEALAFKNPDGTIITQVYNKEDTAKTMTVGVQGTLYQFALPAHGWATLSTSLSTPVKNADKRVGIGLGELKITPAIHGYSVTLPERASGRIELLTIAGRMIESRQIPAESRTIDLSIPQSNAGVFLVRVIQGDVVRTARLTTTP